MTILNGDKIEKLLWENGFDFEHRTGIDGFSWLHVWAGQTQVIVSETWQDAEDWHLDTDTLMFEVHTGDGGSFDDYAQVNGEADLVDHIAYFGE